MATRPGAGVGRCDAVELDLRLGEKDRVDALLEVRERKVLPRRRRTIDDRRRIVEWLRRSAAATRQQQGCRRGDECAPDDPGPGRSGEKLATNPFRHSGQHPEAIQLAIAL